MAIGGVAAVAADVRGTKGGNQEVKRLLERGAFFGVTEAFVTETFPDAYPGLPAYAAGAMRRASMAGRALISGISACT
jgi:hypothetical protein